MTVHTVARGTMPPVALSRASQERASLYTQQADRVRLRRGHAKQRSSSAVASRAAEFHGFYYPGTNRREGWAYDPTMTSKQRTESAKRRKAAGIE